MVISDTSCKYEISGVDEQWPPIGNLIKTSPMFFELSDNTA